MHTIANAVELLVVITAAAVYAERQLRPWKRCPVCRGTGRNRWSTPEHWGYCARCGSSGKVLRFGARRR